MRPPTKHFRARGRKLGLALLAACALFATAHPEVQKPIVGLLEVRPYSGATLERITQNKADIHFFAKQYGIPPVALAGSLADEINRSIGVAGLVDRLQDGFFGLGLLPDSAWQGAHLSGRGSKFTNWALHDIGMGGIKVGSAIEVYGSDCGLAAAIPDHAALVAYLLTERGNIHLAASILKRGQDVFAPHMAQCGTATREAILVTYYKQGDAYWARYAPFAGRRPPVPGEGARLARHRGLIEKALGLD